MLCPLAYESTASFLRVGRPSGKSGAGSSSEPLSKGERGASARSAHGYLHSRRIPRKSFGGSVPVLALVCMATLPLLANTPKIASTMIDYTANQITITGEYLAPQTGAPTVVLNGVTLAPVFFNSTTVVAIMPVGLLPGSYTLTLRSGKNNKHGNHDSMGNGNAARHGARSNKRNSGDNQDTHELHIPGRRLYYTSGAIYNRPGTLRYCHTSSGHPRQHLRKRRF